MLSFWTRRMMLNCIGRMQTPRVSQGLGNSFCQKWTAQKVSLSIKRSTLPLQRPRVPHTTIMGSTKAQWYP
ncbi:hypothetical protein GIB67_039612 [Kingdonia uniflora]|uniref:Uncharacterized protein n=1 Tax=Kingdonia uniflora TaxID=39325 RepID=A0A7J7MDE8_9MAGN|nr:hypothetical protein GIB67_039612 [Kingdonia uniflora]